MSDFDFNDDFNIEEDEPYSPCFIDWNEAREKGIPPGYFDADELCDIIDTFLSIEQIKESREVIEYALKLHPDNENLIYDIMQMLNDYELWDDLLYLSNKYKHLSLAWVDGHNVTALLHLGMEENAFSCFREAKKKYATNEKNLILIYQAMSETLYDVDLYEAAINVIDEIWSKIEKDNEELLWIQLQSYLSIKDTQKVEEKCDKIQKLNPMDANTWSRLGVVYKEIGDKEKSIDAFEFAASLGKKEPIDILNLIYSYKENGNFQKALEKADEYLEKSPDDYVINTLATSLCIDMEAWDIAIRYADKALNVDPLSDFLYLYKSRCHAQLGEIRKAIKTLETGIRKNGDVTGELFLEMEQLKNKYPEY